MQEAALNPNYSPIKNKKQKKEKDYPWAQFRAASIEVKGRR